MAPNDSAMFNEGGGTAVNSSQEPLFYHFFYFFLKERRLSDLQGLFALLILAALKACCYQRSNQTTLHIHR